MAAIKFVHPSTKEDFVSAADALGDEAFRLSPAERGVSLYFRHPGGPEELQLVETTFPPGAANEPHAHVVDEIIFVLEGEIRFGRRVFGVGSSVYIPKLTLYSFRAGAQGVTFLNFRACRDTSGIKKDEFLARQVHQDGAS
jgi:hypothetical protein